jgi:hypothetical protein
MSDIEEGRGAGVSWMRSFTRISRGEGADQPAWPGEKGEMPGDRPAAEVTSERDTGRYTSSNGPAEIVAQQGQSS